MLGGYKVGTGWRDGSARISDPFRKGIKRCSESVYCAKLLAELSQFVCVCWQRLSLVNYWIDRCSQKNRYFVVCGIAQRNRLGGVVLKPLPVFSNSDDSSLITFIEDNPFATLVADTDNGLVGAHLPLLLNRAESGVGTLEGHLAKHNQLWEEARLTRPILAVFSGLNCYVSPSWYPSKKLSGEVVPTWNYVSVHVRGYMTYVDDGDWLLRHLNDLTSRHERTQRDPWEVGDAPKSYIEDRMTKIFGLRIEVSNIVGTWKLSQNKSGDDVLGVVEGIRDTKEPGSNRMAQLVVDHSGLSASDG